MKVIVRERKDEWIHTNPGFTATMARQVGREIEVAPNAGRNMYCDTHRFLWLPEWLIFQNGD